MRALRRREKGKPAARRGRKAYGPVNEQAAGLPNGGWVVHIAPSTPFLPADERSGIGVFRNMASKVMWVGRATVFLVGLAVILALVFGVATMALGATGATSCWERETWPLP